MTKNNNKTTKRQVDKKNFVVVESFTDLQDNNKKYLKGDVFNTEGKPVKRIEELSTRKNKRNRVVIKEQE